MSQPVTISVGERYRLQQLLGQGGMGSVYRAHDRLTGRLVALKLVPVEPGKQPAAGGNSGHLNSAQTLAGTRQDRVAGSQCVRVHVAVSPSSTLANPMWARMALAQEFRTLASLRHLHIISVLDYGFIARSQPFFTMELLENGRSLSTACQGLPLEQKAQLVVQLLRALSYLHHRGILHRDLKPANVMVLDGSEGLHVKLLDFGLALMRSHVEAASGEIAGTLSYLAPEVLEGRAVSEAADLFAVGVIVYELFAGRHPFDRGDDSQLVASILTGEPEWELLGPSAALVTLMRRLLAKSPSSRPSADEALVALAVAVGIPVPQESVALRESALQAACFVGREEPLAVLRTAMDAALLGSGEVRLLAGESGVGKSRLMEELRVYSLVQGVLSVRGQAVSEGGEAYGVWRPILRALCLCTQLDELEAGVLKSLLPDLELLLERTIPEAPALNPQAAQLRLVHVIESLILRQTEPLLLLLEDLQWADTESVTLLRRLVPQGRERPLLIVASYRDDERPDLPRDLPDCPVLKLGRFSATSIEELCRAMLGETGSPPELVRFVESETEGNVFFIIEVLRALAKEAGQLGLVASHRLPNSVLTGGIQAIVQRRLARLPEQARPLLRLAAVAGRQLDLSLLRWFEPNIESFLYLAADVSVLEASDNTWRFAHDKIRESLVQELGPLERPRLHLSIAHAMEQTYPGSPAVAAALADHYQRAERPAQAASYRVEAGRHALSQGATEQAAALLTQALTAESQALLSKLQVARAHNGLVQAQSARGRILPCLQTYEQLLLLVGLPMPASFEAAAAHGGALLARKLRRMRSAALTTPEDRYVWSEVAQATRWGCEAYMLYSQPFKGVVAALHGYELASSIGDTGIQSYCLALFAYVAGLIPLHNVSRSLVKRGTRLMEGVASPRAELDFRRIVATRHMNTGDWKRAISEFDKVIVLSRQIGDEYSLLFGLTFRMIIAFRQQDEAVFEVVGPEQYQRAQRSQGNYFQRSYPLYQGVKALRRGDLELARRSFSEAEGYLQTSQDLVGKIMVNGPTALCLLRQGDKDGALQRAQELLALVESTRFPNELVGEGLAAVAEVFLCLWESWTADERQKLSGPLRRALAVLRRCALVFPACAPRALLLYGRHAWNHGARWLALRLGETSRRRARRFQMPYDEALARTWLKRFAETPPAATPGLAGELRGIFQFLARSLG